MLDIIIESPFLPDKKIKLDESKWTIEKLTDVITGKIKVLGKKIDKNAVVYEFEFSNGKKCKLSNLEDYPLHLKSFTNKFIALNKHVTDNLVLIRVTFSNEHFTRISQSMKTLENDTVDKFIQRTRRKSSMGSLNLESLKIEEITDIDSSLTLFSDRYTNYKSETQNRWKNVLSEMKKRQMIGNSKEIIPVTTSNIDGIERDIENLDNPVKKSVNSKNTNDDCCYCCWKPFRKTKKLNKLKNAGFSYNFEKETAHNDEDVYSDDIIDHDDNIFYETQVGGNMFYTWDDDDDFLLSDDEE